jgi:hypothetical protein
LGHKAKWEYSRAVYERYHKAGREAKQMMLNEFCLNSGYHRKYAIRLLNGAPPGKQPERRRRERRPRYGPQVLSILAAIWEAAGSSLVGATEGLAAELDALDSQALPNDPGDGEAASGHQCSTNGPRLRAQKSERKRRVYGRTKPGSLLKHHIPVKTDSWDVTSPGFSEIDLVAHCGNSGEGEFAHTLNLTDIHSGWTVVPNHDEQPVVCHATSMRLLDAQIDVAWHAYRAIAATDALLVRTGSLQDLHTGLVLV